MAGSQQDKMFEFQQNLLTQEIEYIQAQISRFDGLSFQIKGWAITVWTAVVAFGVKEKIPLVVLASLPAIFAFWLLDALFKRYQYRYGTRKTFIEKFLDSQGYFKENGLRSAFAKRDFGSFPIHDPIASRTRKLAKEIEEHFKERTNFRKAFLVPNVVYFYLLLIFGALIITAGVG